MSENRYQKHAMIEYLVKNNRENVQEYILGYKTVKDILKETGLPRYAFYTAIEELNPDIPKIKKEKKNEILDTIHKQIMRCIPYEHIEFDAKRMFGRNGAFESYTIDKQKSILVNLLDINGFEISDRTFISLSRMLSWYKRYRIRNDLRKGTETGYSIGKKYDISTSTVYIIKKNMKENKQLLTGTTLLQESILLENFEIYKQYKNGKTKEQLIEDYNIEQWILNILLNSMRIVEETIEDIVNQSK